MTRRFRIVKIRGRICAKSAGKLLIAHTYD
jgi:hypothetical protein